MNVFQVCVETLLFYHPAVWWLNKRIRAEREHCCDDMAVTLCGNAVEYARALTLMEEWRSAPVFAMAANRGPLTERIMRVLGLKTLGAGMRGIGLTGSLLCLTAALVAGNALLGIWRILRRRARIPGLQAVTESADKNAQPAAPLSTPVSQTTRHRNKDKHQHAYRDHYNYQLRRWTQGCRSYRPERRHADSPENSGCHSRIRSRTAGTRSASGCGKVDCHARAGRHSGIRA